MDAALLLLMGEGDLRFSRPAVELQVAQDLGRWQLASFSRLVEGGWNSQRFEVAFKATDSQTATLQYYTGNEGHGKDAVQAVLKTPLGASPFTLTTSYSPDAFGAGPRYRVGMQAYKRVGDVSVWVWMTGRYLSRFDKIDQESWYTLNYHASDTVTLSLSRFDSDFFGDNVTVQFKYKL